MIAHRRLQDERRRRTRRPAVADEEFDESRGAAVGDVEEDALRLMATERVEAICARLVPDQRDVLLLRVVGDLTIEQIAEVLEKSPGAVKQLQRRAFEAVRRLVATGGRTPMTRPGDDGFEMPHDPFDDSAIERLLAGDTAGGGDLAPLSSFIDDARTAAEAVPPPSPALAAALATGILPALAPAPQSLWRKSKMKIQGFLAGLGVAGKLALGVGVAAAATTGAGAAGVLPGPVQHAVASAVGAVTPFEIPDGPHHDGDNIAEPGDTTTTTVEAHGDDGDTTPVTEHHGDVTPTPTTEHHDGDTTPTTVRHSDGDGETTPTTERSGDGDHESTPTTEHHDDGDTTPTTENHDGDTPTTEHHENTTTTVPHACVVHARSQLHAQRSTTRVTCTLGGRRALTTATTFQVYRNSQHGVQQRPATRTSRTTPERIRASISTTCGSSATATASIAQGAATVDGCLRRLIRRRRLQRSAVGVVSPLCFRGFGLQGSGSSRATSLQTHFRVGDSFGYAGGPSLSSTEPLWRFPDESTHTTVTLSPG